MRNSWPVRHPLLSILLILGVFAAIGIALWAFVNPFYLLLLIPGFALYIRILVLSEKWIWVCSECGREQYWRREKYCERCGGKMTLKREEVLKKYCENGHRIEDKYNLASRCPKCGKPFVEEKVELK